MMKSELSFRDYQLYLLKSLLWLGLAWGGFLFTLIGFFHAWLIWSIFLFTAVWLTKHAGKNNFSLKPSKEMLRSGIIFLVIVIFFSLFSTPTVFTGRDQGSFAEAAVRLSQNHKLEFSTPTGTEFFKLHESGRALNFPGFYYTKSGTLVTQFSLVYISWLALFFSIFGVAGFIVANAILLFIFFFSFYLLIRLFVGNLAALPTMLFTLTSFVFMWFSRMTLSENMALALLWTAIVALCLLLKNPKKLYYLIFLIASLLLCFTRIEGFAFLLSSIIVIALHKNLRHYIKEDLTYRLFLPVAIFVVILGLNIFNDFYFYKEIFKALLPTVTLPKAKYLGQLKNNILPDFYIEKIFFLYGLLGFFVVGTFSIVAKLWKNEFHKLVPFFVTLPTFIYFIDDHISADHPWMLRRFVFSLAPVMIFYTGLMIGQWFERKNKSGLKITAVALTIILLIGNLPAFLKYVTFSENKDLLSQTKTLSTQFSSNDLVLIDQNATGDGWSMISGPLNFLYGKNAVYFFNTQDLTKLNTKAFDNIYLIAPNSQVAYYLNSTIGPRLSEVSKYNFNITKLDTQKEGPLNALSLPEKTNMSVQGKIFKVSKQNP